MEGINILKDFGDDLQNLRTARLSVLERANEGATLCRKTLVLLRKEVVVNGFSSETEEIHFFKQIKSVPLQHLVYYTEVHQCELRMPQLGRDAKLDFLGLERERINRFYHCHFEFHRYLLEGRKEFDVQYFTREHGGHHPIENYKYRYDTQFETSHDLLLATFKGLERYGNYLKGLEEQISAIHAIGHSDDLNKQTAFVFTLPPTAAVEMAYALREARAINHGNFEIKAFMDYFCQVFGIEIQDPYGLFAQITNRKKHRAKYLQRLLDAFLSFLDGRDA
ncbi:RteC domain-containing protein [Croceitalea sp. MTPC9]|uniref:RteC domain-containing protein n=1 Tax=unclassified Croceitalea TaxID=2632280 RepID=UPI002B3E9B5D|nr:RteC domain-containing protein [Croceitalea sp. MTPC6]GMN16127.1 RteC domain-containing protein [Croceitalea sp. MTPC9]